MYAATGHSGAAAVGAQLLSMPGATIDGGGQVLMPDNGVDMLGGNTGQRQQHHQVQMPIGHNMAPMGPMVVQQPGHWLPKSKTRKFIKYIDDPRINSKASESNRALIVAEESSLTHGSRIKGCSRSPLSALSRDRSFGLLKRRKESCPRSLFFPSIICALCDRGDFSARYAGGG